ncbi:ExbD/TolR family protein [Pedosphaera parvula]|uniref:Biopolymer transport protein ExbD/TolR n=1 Tax=Pedosphaera parvula (strain Ellin514) TaxID=320771 RepID=B9XKH5_PEDPL|nr:biopolymer transporter ExbD [Pedosphaera parvula]EEF59645.1 Biopolymer transport protein ExbD/TolR [Pedosphaera parvula Ellin514]
MRRFSQRNSLVTLNEINITPLLDLAFVLLIIFIITTPLLEKGINLQLPTGVGQPDKPSIQKKDIKMIEVSPQGYYVLDHRPLKLAEIARTLELAYKANPNLLVYIRADENGKYKLVAEILNECERIGINKISLRTDPQSPR